MKTLIFSTFTLITSLFFSIQLRAQELVADGNTLLLLHFNNSLIGANGENPQTGTGITYQPGIFNNGAYLDNGNLLQYLHAANLDETTGSFECWMKPTWNGNDGQDHIVLRCGGAGGMLLCKDGGNYLKNIFNRYGIGGNPEAGVGYNVTSVISANNWYHIAFTWGGGTLKLYLNGDLITTSAYSFSLPLISDNTFDIGSENGNSTINATIDELRISNVIRTDAEIAESFMAGVTVTAINITPDSSNVLSTWWITPTIISTTNFGILSLPLTAFQWTSSSNSVVTVDSEGKITAVSNGSCYVTASRNGISDSVFVNVSDPLFPPEHPAIDTFLSSPANCAMREMPIVVICYLPPADSVNLDFNLTDINSTLTNIKSKIEEICIQAKFMLEEGSRFRGYKDSTALPFLGYKVLDYIIVYEDLPKGFVAGTNMYFADFNQILTRFDGAHYVNDLGIKEFWLFGWHHGQIVPVESNMSSPATGDISNSYRFPDDLPIYDHTYVLYNYNYGRTSAEAVHNHGHQFESIYNHANNLQDGNTDLFMKKFVGWDPNNIIGPPIGRCGDTHHPVNTTSDYDYTNMTLVSSDIEDWLPDGGGITKMINASTWGNLPYAWPYNNPPVQKIEAQWYIYWMQNMPGMANSIPYTTNSMTNWWEFTSDWDKAITDGLGLYSNGMPSFGACGCANDPGMVVSSPTGNSLQWFSAQTGGTPFYTGTNLSINISADTIFYIADPTLNQTSRTTVFVKAKDCGFITGVSTPSSNRNNISIEPNPNGGIFTVYMKELKNPVSELTLTDITGKTVYSSKPTILTYNYMKQIDVSLFAKGVYFLHLKTGTQLWSKKMVIQ